ncbi:monovalent cation/H+ antiporter subunit D family protein, partial [Alphaproteobacteria bacterium]|nr:monovalent cation/H+ antiporter subunit D family protein [Alphaproteobacteria bacterium]
MMQHLPVLQVLLPLLGAPLAALLRGRDMAWGLALLLTGAAFLISAVLFGLQFQADGPLIYDLGGWPAPLGIVYVIDAASALVLPVVSGLAFVATIAARRLVEAEIDV